MTHLIPTLLPLFLSAVNVAPASVPATGKQEAVVVGDTEHEYEVARAMDADSILIANGHQSKARLQALGVPVLDDVRSLFR